MEPAIQNVTIDDALQRIHSEEKERAIKEWLILRGYPNGAFNIGEVTKALGLSFDETRKWLEDRNIPLLRKLPPELEKSVHKNIQDLVDGKLPHLHFDPWENQQLLMEAEICFQEKMKEPEFRKAWEEDEIRPEIEKEPRQAIRERLIIQAYIHGMLSMGDVAELLDLKYVIAQKWLHGQGIATMRGLPPELKDITDKSLHNVAKRLNINLTE
ncbi:MAG: hypothetical protein HQK59_05135 [Deltaproteobacteria bacterium]|nr:hypothetical protein [Deltaproteobacteria bacterium]